MKRLFYICNALDDRTRIERGIVTDSPAASRKIFSLCSALRTANVHPVVVSLGRGRRDGSGRYYRCEVRRVNGIAVVYLPFVHLPLLSEVLSLFSLIPVLFRLRLFKGMKVALFYNPMPSYLLGLLTARLLRFKTVLDLEDGATSVKGWSISAIKVRVQNYLYDSLCWGGGVLACSALENDTRMRPVYCCYGATQSSVADIDFCAQPIRVLLGGTISLDTGAQLLIEAINILREAPSEWAASIQFEISGKGDYLDRFRELAEDIRLPRVVVHGRISDEEYEQILQTTQVGLALKPNSGVLAHTTFPSKVIELASHGILVLSTDISDVRMVLANGALYLTKDDPNELIDHLQWIASHLDEVKVLAARGKERVDNLCSPHKVGLALEQFLFSQSKLEAR